MAGQNLSGEELKELTEGFFCRPMDEDQDPQVTPAGVPVGMFNPLIMPTVLLGPHENSLVHSTAFGSSLVLGR